ncbi:MAG: phage tail tape measure protein, partial [Deltaproteobacteria bacterium]|nr:phage tail tape measure protein [Deltaproteobacteria bacterium]
MHAALATLTKGGFKTSEASARLATALGTIIKPSSEAVKLTEELGLEFNASALKAKGLHGFLQDVKKATGGNVEEMAQLFGGMESLSVMLALTGKQSQEFTDILGRMGNVSGATEEAFNKQKETLGDLWDTFKNFAEKQAILLGAELAPYLKDVLNTTMAWCEANRDLIAQKIPEYASKIAKTVSDIAKAISFVSGLAIPGSLGIIGLVLFGPVGGAIALALGLIIKNMRDFEKNFGKLQKKISSGNMDVMDSFNMLGADAAYMYESTADAGAAAAKAQADDYANLKRAAKLSTESIVKDVAGQNKALLKISKKTGVEQVKISAKTTKAIADDVEKAWNLEIKASEATAKAYVKSVKDKVKAADDYAKESTRIYERMADSVNKTTLGEKDYREKILNQQYDSYKKHLSSLAEQDEKYADGVKLLDVWLKDQKAEIWKDWAREHGNVLDTMKVAWDDFKDSALNVSETMYKAWKDSLGLMKTALSDTFYSAFQGNISDIKNIWSDLAGTLKDTFLRMITDIAAEKIIMYFKNAWSGDPTGKGTIEKMIGIDVPFLTFASGGKVPGAYNGRKGFAGDTVPIMATPGEYMVRREVAQNPAIRSLLDALNQSGAGAGMIAAGKNIPALGATGMYGGGIVEPQLGHYGWGFIGDLWEGAKDVGGALWEGAKDIGSALWEGAK